jgi:hypothetical protein
MKKITLLVALAIFTFSNSYGQLNVSVDNPDGTGWNPYVNAFNVSDGLFAFGFPYDLAKQKTEFDGTAVTLKPNYGIWVDACSDPAWFDNNTCPNPSSPNKNIEALSYLQVDRTPNPEFFNQDVIFSGDVNSFTIDAAYTVKAFISVFPNDFSYNTQYTDDITGAGTFSVTRPVGDVVGSDQFLQYGFIVFGPPADPANEATLGAVVVQDPALSTSSFEALQLMVYPNPAENIWNVKSQNVIESITVHDVLGKQVLQIKPNDTDINIDASTLSKGLYFAKMTTEVGSNSVKLIKN